MDADFEGQDEEQAFNEYLDAGTELVGGVTGFGVAAMVSGPVGGFLGALAPVAVRVIRRSALDHMHRQLSARERMRTAAVVRIATARTQQMLALGYEARSDGFFQGAPGNRSVAAELVEGVLISAQREHEEMKIPYLGNLLANIAFHDWISRGEANLLLRLADRLSYRQLCLLALFGRKAEFPNLRDGTFVKELREVEKSEREELVELIGLLVEAEELFDLGMVTQERRVIFAHGEGLNPANAMLFRYGAALYDLMELRDVPRDELEPLAATLR